MRKKFKKWIAITLILLTILAGVNVNAFIEVKASSESSIGVASFNCGAYSTQANSKGDASIIDCGDNTYVLVDCGPNGSYQGLKDYMTRNCARRTDSKYKGKIYLNAVIISHNHADHMNALNKLLKDADFYVAKIYYCNAGKSELRSNLRRWATESGTEYECVSAGTMVKKWYGEAVIRIFGPSKTATAKYPNWMNKDGLERMGNSENNCSMVVTASARDDSFSAIFLGDLGVNGLKYALGDKYIRKNENGVPQEYSICKENQGFDFCKFGHHGQRRSDDYAKSSNEEVQLYNQKIHATKYVFTTTIEHLDEIDRLGTENMGSALTNYEYLTEKLVNKNQGKAKVYIFQGDKNCESYQDAYCGGRCLKWK